jgi:MscS family membrane protein
MVDFISLLLLERAKKTVSMSDDQLIRFVKEAVKVFIAAIGFLILLGIAFRLNVVSLITGLGIGGLAIALAAKETLENLLGSFTIFLDKPFITGDTVRVGNVEGRVESVGFRSTRIRAVDKMMVTVPNKKMVDAELINDTDREVRRSALSIVLSYDTTEDQLKNILSEIKQVIKEHPLIEKNTESIRFKTLIAGGLEVAVIYIVLTADVNEFMEVQEEINFQIIKIIKGNGAVFSIPENYKQDQQVKNSGNSIKYLSAGKT